MEEIIKEISEKYPEAIVNNEIDYKKLTLILFTELSDVQDQLKEKDYQVLRITEKLDKLCY